MSTIQVFEPALCCSSGVCGQDVDAELVQASADFDWAKGLGARLERFNLAQQPLAFAQHEAVRGLLERSGQDALPVTLMDGQVMLAGRYPSRAQLTQWLKLEAGPSASPSAGEAPRAAPRADNGCCSGGKCC